MKKKYQAWIEEFANRRGGNVRHACGTATKEMVRAFPELKIVRGFAFPSEEEAKHVPTPEMDEGDKALIWDNWTGVEQHYWCEAPDGTIVDPTRAQYDCWPGVVYVPYNEELHGPTPTGKCMNCGCLTFPPYSGVCSNTCEKEFEDYLAAR